MNSIDIRTQDGTVDCYTFQQAEGSQHPAVIFYMDGVGIRPALFEMAQRLADLGYFVLLPNLYYRAGSYAQFDPATVFNEGPDRERLMGLLKTAGNQAIMRDTEVFLNYLLHEPSVAGEKVGCVGYCLGGRLALSAAGTYPESIVVAVSIHGGGLATDNPDSPHLLAEKMRGKVYIGVAEIDRGFSQEQKDLLVSALDAAQVDYTLELYPGVAHGFAIPDLPVYDHEASERHWQRIQELFHESLLQS